MGGDLVNVVRDDDGTDLFVANVSGHGVRAGVVMGMVKAALRMGRNEPGGLDGLVARLSNMLESTTSHELYATLAAIRLDSSGGNARYLLAGHHHFLHYRARTSATERHSAPGLPVGLMAGSSWESHEIALDSGDLLAVYTDGLNETMNADDEELGHEAIESCVRNHAERPLDELRAALFRKAEDHGPQLDDRSLLLVRVR